MSNFISLQEAQDYTTRFRANKEKMLTEGYKDSLPFSETFDADAIQTLLNQEGCVKFRAYYGMNDKNEVCMIFVGVDANDEDILNNNILLDRGNRCPPYCNFQPL